MVTLDLSRLDDRTLMDLQDHVHALSRPWRELAVLAECCDLPMAALAELPLGIRDRLLLGVRAQLFGSRIDAESRCDGCGERLDLSFDVAAMLGATVESNTAGEMRHGAARFRLRAPNSADLAEAAAATDPEEAVLARCVESDTGDMVSLLHDAGLRTAIAERLAQIDPQAETTLAAQCPHCGATNETVFDPGGYLLEEIASYTDRLVDEVDQLARAYGWREADILALGPRRRRRYLELTS